MKKQTYNINLISKNVSTYNFDTKNLNYECDEGEIVKKYVLNVKPKKLYSKLKPILKQQKYNMALKYIQIQLMNKTKCYPSIELKLENETFKNNLLTHTTLKQLLIENLK